MDVFIKKPEKAQTGVPRIFVSFSSREGFIGDFVRLLWQRLSEQPLDIFNYERPNEEIRPGQDIEQACKDELKKANYCFVVISDGAFKSPWTKMEVRYALSLNRQNYLFPIILTCNRTWPFPFNKLMVIKALYSYVDEQSFTAKKAEEIVEEIVHLFCSDQNIKYFPPNTDLPRIPLRRKIYGEIFAVGNESHKLRSRDIDSLFQQCNHFNKLYSDGDIESAQKKLDRISDDMEYFFRGVVPYYPKLMRIVLALQLEEKCGYNLELLENLKSEINALIKNSESSVDANAFGLLGNLELLLCRPEAALQCYEKAESYLTEVDPAIIHNKILSIVLSGRKKQLSYFLNTLDTESKGTLVSQLGDLTRIRIVHAIALCYEGHLVDAIAKLEYDRAICGENFDIVRQFLDEALNQAKRMADRNALSQVLGLMDAIMDVIERIDKPSIPEQWVSLAQRKALLALELGENEKAIGTISKVLSDEKYKNSVPLLTHAALIYHADQKNNDAIKFANRALLETNLENQKIPTSKNDFEYHRGLAAWLLGKNDLARDCFMRAGGDSRYRWYDGDFTWVRRKQLSRICFETSFQA